PFATGGVLINRCPPFLFLWSINLFVLPMRVVAYFCISLVFLVAVVVLGALDKGPRVRTATITGGWVALLLLGWLVLPMMITNPMAVIMIVLLSLLAASIAGWRLGVFGLIALTLVASVDQWTNAMDRSEERRVGKECGSL